MAERYRIVLFCEDADHEQFVRSLVHRLSQELGIPVTTTPISARGGKAEALTQLRGWQRKVAAIGGSPDLLVAMVDGNCEGWQRVRQEVESRIDAAVIPRAVVGVPHPHIERWFFADPAAFEQVLGVNAGEVPEKCERALYKALLGDRLARSREIVLSGPAELAPDLVERMDLYRAGKNQPSLGQLIHDLRAALRQLVPGQP